MTIPKGPVANPNVNPVPMPSSAPSRAKAPAPDDAGNMSAYQSLERRRQKRRRKRIVQVSIAAAALLAAVGGFAAFAHFNNQDVEIPPYDIGYAVQGGFETSVSASGSTQPNASVVVTPEVDGIIETVLVEEGDTVSKGDVLFTLKNDDLDKAVTEAEQAVKTAQNGVASAELNLKNARDARLKAEQEAYAPAATTPSYDKDSNDGYDEDYYESMAGLGGGDTGQYPGSSSYAGPGASSNTAVAEAQIAVDAAQIELDNANIALASAIEARDQAKATAAKRTVTAPQDGTIVALDAKTGAAVGAAAGGAGAASGSLATIADLEKLRVTVQVNEIDINKLAVGQKAFVSFTALPDVILDAEVEHIASVATGAGGEQGFEGSGGIVTYAVDVVIPKPDSRVKPGMTANVKVVTQSLTDVVTVPVSALTMWSETQASVFVIVEEGETFDDAVVEEREVTVLAQDSVTAVVEGDIADGDMVQIPTYSAEEDDMMGY